MSNQVAKPITPEAKLKAQLTKGGVSFYMPAPGVVLDKGNSAFSFFTFLESSVFKESIGLTALLPVSLSGVTEITIQSLSFSPASGTDLIHLSFALAMEAKKAAWEVIPGLLLVEDIIVKVNINGSIVTANLYGTLKIKDLEFTVALELPSGYMAAQLKTTYKKGVAQPSTATAKGAFEHFKLAPIGKGGAPTLDSFKILASPRAHQASLSMALSKIKICHFDLALQLALNYAGHPNGHLTGSFWGGLAIKKNDGTTIDMMISAEHNEPDSGWQFEGALEVASGELNLAYFVENNINVKGFPGKNAILPKALGNGSKLDLKSVAVAFNSKTKDFKFSCAVDGTGLFGADSKVDLHLDFHLSRSEDSGAKDGYTYTKKIDGQLVFKTGSGADQQNFEFDVDFTTDATSKAFVAVYSNLAGAPISINDLIKAFDPKPPFDIPINISLKDVFFAFVNDGTPKNKYLFGIDLGGGMSLAELPLIGNILGPNNKFKLGLQPIITSAGFTAEEVQTISDLVPGGKVALPAKALAKGVDLACKLSMGTTSILLDLPISMKKEGSSYTGVTGDPASVALTATADGDAPSATSGESGTSPATGGPVHWFPVQKGFGPVYFNRIGVQFKADTSAFWLLLDTELAAGPLTLVLNGLGVGSPLALPLSPSFTLNGIGLDYESGPLEIGGTFLRATATDPVTHDSYTEYNGLAILKMEELSISALGSYARINGQTSLFVYATLDYPIGGPSFFFVEGLALGFGYNRQLKMPPIGEVADFPLVSTAMNGGGGLPGGNADRGAYLQKELTELQDYIPPRLGEYFLTAGVHFSSFEMIDSFVLVDVSFGEHFEIDLLGLSRLVVPVPEQGSSVPALAVAELAVKASYDPERGFLGVQAQLTNNSYVLSHQCHLSGGFAFYSWFKDDKPAKSGDFVLSLGGYHPAFRPPSYYPHVPRLGYNWRISSDLSIKGGMYFALTPNVLMAGGHMDANFDNGHVRAWFNASADFIVYWKPYHYDARFHIDVGGKAWIVKFDAGADVHLWGPAFAGVATIDCCAVSFTVHFGDSSPSAQPLSWDQFYTSFLPKADKICTVAVEKGLIKKEGATTADLKYIINPKDFSLTVNSLIPITDSYWGAAGSDKATGHTGTSFGVAPMNLNKVESSNLYINITHDGGGDNADFKLTPVTKNLPAAQWGDEFKPALNGDALVPDLLAGFRIEPAKALTPGKTQSIEKSKLKYAINFVDKAFGFENATDFQFAKGDEEADRITIGNTITDSKVVAQRNELLAALGMQAQIKKCKLSPAVANEFVEAPLVGLFNL